MTDEQKPVGYLGDVKMPLNVYTLLSMVMIGVLGWNTLVFRAGNDTSDSIDGLQSTVKAQGEKIDKNTAAIEALTKRLGSGHGATQ